jgi:hypothetical protein
VGIRSADDGVAAAIGEPFDPAPPAGDPGGEGVHRLEGVGSGARIAVCQRPEQTCRRRHPGRQQRVRDHGDRALIVNGSDGLAERQPGRDPGREADPDEVPLASRDLLPDHQIDRGPFTTRAGDELQGHGHAVMVGEDGDLQVARQERRIHRHGRPRDRGPRADGSAAGVNVEIGAADRWQVRHRGHHHRGGGVGERPGPRAARRVDDRQRGSPFDRNDHLPVL